MQRVELIFSVGTGFIVGFGLRSGVSVVVRLVFLLRRKPHLVWSLHELLYDRKAHEVKVNAVRLGLTLGGIGSIFLCYLSTLCYKQMQSAKSPSGITGSYKLIYALLLRLRQKVHMHSLLKMGEETNLRCALTLKGRGMV